MFMAGIIRGNADDSFADLSFVVVQFRPAYKHMNTPTNLRCEYFVNPLAIDVARPRLSWIVNDDRRGAKQTAYQVVVSAGKTELWDSGKVDSDLSIHLIYNGEALKSRMHCEWKVRNWDLDGKP